MAGGGGTCRSNCGGSWGLANHAGALPVRAHHSWQRAVVAADLQEAWSKEIAGSTVPPRRLVRPSFAGQDAARFAKASVRLRLLVVHGHC